MKDILNNNQNISSDSTQFANGEANQNINANTSKQQNNVKNVLKTDLRKLIETSNLKSEVVNSNAVSSIIDNDFISKTVMGFVGGKNLEQKSVIKELTSSVAEMLKTDSSISKFANRSMISNLNLLNGGQNNLNEKETINEIQILKELSGQSNIQNHHSRMKNVDLNKHIQMSNEVEKLVNLAFDIPESAPNFMQLVESNGIDLGKLAALTSQNQLTTEAIQDLKNGLQRVENAISKGGGPKIDIKNKFDADGVATSVKAINEQNSKIEQRST